MRLPFHYDLKILSPIITHSNASSAKRTAITYDEQVVQRLWTVSEEMTNQRFTV